MTPWFVGVPQQVVGVEEPPKLCFAALGLGQAGTKVGEHVGRVSVMAYQASKREASVGSEREVGEGKRARGGRGCKARGGGESKREAGGVISARRALRADLRVRFHSSRVSSESGTSSIGFRASCSAGVRTARDRCIIA